MVRTLIFIFVLLICLFTPERGEAERDSLNIEEAGYYEFTDLYPPFPENVEVRKLLKEIIFAPAVEAMRASQGVFVQKNFNNRVLFQVKRQNGAFYLLFTNEENYSFPLYSRGSYIIKRSLEDGSLLQIKIFLRNHPECFLRIFPRNDRSSMDVYLYGYPVYQNINLPISLQEITTSPFNLLKRMSKNSVDWSLIFSPEAEQYKEVRLMAEKIRGKLPELRDADDGAMNQNGEYVLIEDLSIQESGGFNCSGFAKWIVDGIYYLKNGRYLPIERLKDKNYSTRGHRWSERYEDSRDPYFGLDWTRNLSLSLLETESESKALIDPEVADVREVPFFDYIEDVGYPVENLKLILYLISKKEPGFFYLGSINGYFGENPGLHQHFHIVVLFPYFSSDGSFKVSVMERNMETDLNSLQKRYRGDFIHLVKIKADAEIILPETGKK